MNEQIDEFVVVGNGVLIKYNGKATHVEIPKNVKVITDAFSTNETVKSVVIGNNVETIGYSAFAGCTNLVRVTVSSKVKVIEASAFSSCKNLAEIYLPSSLGSIGQSAFSRCSSLKTVNFAGSQKSWSKITVEKGNDVLTSTTINYSVKP